MSQRPIRQQPLVEHDVQVSLIFRVVLYGAACMTYFTVIQFFTQAMHHPGIPIAEVFLSLTDEAIYWVPGFLVLGPLMVYDMLRITNRIAGPIFSVRCEMRALNAGERGRGLRFRNDVYWDTLATEFNEIRQQIIDLREENDRLRSELPAQSGAEDASEARLSKQNTNVEKGVVVAGV